MSRQGLPLLPGYTFDAHLLRDRHDKRHIFDYKNNINVIKDVHPKSEEEMRNELLTSEKLLEKYKIPKRGIEEHLKEVKEQEEKDFMGLECKVLRFFCFFKEGVAESNVENFRVRKCVLYFFLEDDTVMIVEPKEDNSCLVQGKLVKRHRVYNNAAKRYFNFEDFAPLGTKVEIYGKVFLIVSCDAFTRRFYEEKLSMSIGEDIAYPFDKYRKDMKEKSGKVVDGKITLSKDDWEIKRFMEYSYKGRRCQLTNEEKVLSQRFFELDGKVLEFQCIWDDRNRLYGEYRHFILQYFLSNDKIKVSEKLKENSGRDPFPVFIKKSMIPLEEEPSVSTNRNRKQQKAYVHWKDLAVGGRISLYGKRFFLYDCDSFTRKFYSSKGIQLGPRVEVTLPKKVVQKASPPPYNGFGTEEDSLNNWKHLFIKPLRRDMKKLIKYDKVSLRFLAKMLPREERKEIIEQYMNKESPVSGELQKEKDTKESLNPFGGHINVTQYTENLEESAISAQRRFVVNFHMGDDSISVFEPEIRNSGISGGKFFERKRFKNPQTNTYFNASDFFIGQKMIVNQFPFLLLEADERTLSFMEEHRDEEGFTCSNIRWIMFRLSKQRERIDQVLQQIRGSSTMKEAYDILRPFFGNKHEFLTFWRHFTKQDYYSQKGASSSSSSSNNNNIQEIDLPSCLQQCYNESVDLDEEKAKYSSAKQEKTEREAQIAEQCYKIFLRKYQKRPFYFAQLFRREMDKNILEPSTIGPQQVNKVIDTYISIGDRDFEGFTQEHRRLLNGIIFKYTKKGKYTILDEFIRRLKRDIIS